MPIKGVIFDLDGVIVSTDEYHCQSWLQLAKDHNIHFDRSINNRLRGLSRSESLEIFLERADQSYSEEQKRIMASEKNRYYLELLDGLSAANILPGVVRLLKELKSRRIRLAIGSSSKNCPMILDKIGLSHYFGACIDGNQVSLGKPDPEIFLKASKAIALPPEECLVIEDGTPGIQAAHAAGMKVLGVGSAVGSETAAFTVTTLDAVDIEQLLAMS